MQDKINLLDKFEGFTDFWSPRVISELNNYQVKLAKFHGEFIWHSHQDTDELFLVIEGEMTIEFRDKVIQLCEGELYVVPKGVEHKPSSNETCKVLLLEPKGLVNTGESSSDLTADNDVWI